MCTVTIQNLTVDVKGATVMMSKDCGAAKARLFCGLQTLHGQQSLCVLLH